MNTIKLEIFNYTNNTWIDYSNNVVFPLKYANLLDEQLDEAELQLQYVDKEIFEPLTKAKVTIINSPEAKYTQEDANNLLANSDYAEGEGLTVDFNYSTNRITVTKEILMLVANDRVVNRPIGTSKYNHEIYLIEFTKFLEGFIGDSITFTNSLGNNYADYKNLTFDYYANNSYVRPMKSNTYKSVYEKNSEVQLETNVSDFLINEMNIFVTDKLVTTNDGIYISFNGINVYKQYVYESKLYQQVGDLEPVKLAEIPVGPTPWQPYTLTLETLGQLKIEYKWREYSQEISCEANFYVFENRYPIKKWTIADVISRTLETVETLRGLETPRFKLQGTYYEFVDRILRRRYEPGSLADKLDKILAPEFTFTKMTLREMLQQVGGYIHGEPRISRLVTQGNGYKFYEIVFDDYGITDKSYLSQKNYPFISREQSVNINEYCTSLDTTADNLINSLNYAQGVTVEPFAKHHKTVRATKSTIRLEENDNCVIQTLKPIYEIGLENQLICRYMNEEYDLTPYVFNYTDYVRFSSYSGSYPFNKAYALYYVQGEKDIRGLFFKNPDAISPFFKKYAISNIMSAVTGQSLDFSIGEIATQLQFEVRYVPIIKERIKTNKPTVKLGLPRLLAYNQSANALETRFLGENLKGVIARLGNVEKSVTYMFAFLSEIPKVGLKYDDNYYISAVSVEVLPTCLKATLGLSKDFNRQSEYVSLNSEKRMWEVSERQSIERDSIITDYVVITEGLYDIELEAYYNYLYEDISNSIVDELFNRNEGSRLISASTIKSYTKNGSDNIHNYFIVLPVLSTAIGNSLTFTFSFEDNYSAGQRIVSETIDNEPNFYSSYVPYTDYYGRVYYIDFWLSTISSVDYDAPIDYPFSREFVPITKDGTTYGSVIVDASNKIDKRVRRITYQKDNREVPSITYEMQFVSNGSVIIGSALASNCKLVNESPQTILLVLLNKPINNINPKISAENVIENVDWGKIEISKTSITLPSIDNIDQKQHVAWAIATGFQTKTLTVSDEDGNTIEQTIYEGGEVLIGQNKQCNGQMIYFSLLSELYKKF